MDISGLTRICTSCKEEKYYYEFNKGNALNGYKSECKICQRKRHKKYKKRPEVKERNKEWTRERYRKYTQEERTAIYLKRKDYVLSWQKQNPDKYRRVEKRKGGRRKKWTEQAGKLFLSSVAALENYNLQHFKNEFFTCEYCLKEIIDESYHLEHLLPLCRNGTNELSNLGVSCRSCNSRKSKRTVEEFMPELVEYFKNRKII